ncbi:MAG: putative DNA-binding domain-containing protein [Gammaproteobacteria bacterium]|nr:putative DNA-binding domain-containing protein [Gammaproteobacteria bacterium]
MSASPEPHDFRAFQASLAARIRDPRGQPRPPGVPARRMRVYEELLYNNLEGFLLACFPITRRLLGARAWRAMVRRFFAEHRSHSPLFRDIPGEFLAWFEPLAEALFPKRPYLYDFMHYEWVELAVSVAEEEVVPPGLEPGRELLAERPRLNPTARLAGYSYPVHRIRPRYRPKGTDKGAYWYLVYRDAAHAVRFIVLNPLSARLLELIRDTDLTGRAAMLRIADEMNHENPDLIVEMGRNLLEKLRHAGAVY